MSAWGGLKRQRIYGVLFPVLLGALGLLTLGLASGVWLAGAAMFGIFLTGPIMNAHSQAIWQAQVSPELQGRVFSVRRLIAQFTGPLSVGLAGLLAARFSGRPALLLILAGLMVTVVLVQLVNPSLRRVEDREYLEALAQRLTERRAAGCEQNLGARGLGGLNRRSARSQLVKRVPTREEGFHFPQSREGQEVYKLRFKTSPSHENSMFIEGFTPSP